MTTGEYNDLDRPFEVEDNPQLSRLSDVPDWKKPDYHDYWEDWEDEHPYSTTDFHVPNHTDREDWW